MILNALSLWMIRDRSLGRRLFKNIGAKGARHEELGLLKMEIEKYKNMDMNGFEILIAFTITMVQTEILNIIGKIKRVSKQLANDCNNANTTYYISDRTLYSALHCILIENYYAANAAA